MLIPSTYDDTLAPPGKHVASLFCQQFNPHIEWNEEQKEAATKAILSTVTKLAPNFESSIIAKTVLSPRDLEEKFGLIGGDIFHGTLTLDQLYTARPVLGHGNYRGPIRNLFMCGSGTHPGGGVTGLPGLHAANEIVNV